MLRYSFEAPLQGTANEYSQHLFHGNITKLYQYIMVKIGALSRLMVYKYAYNIGLLTYCFLTRVYC